MEINTTLESAQLPDSFWRVSAKALIYDTENRLLVFMDKNQTWEIPGGGWDHGETFNQCIERELAEEMQVGVTSISPVIFCYNGQTLNGYPKISIACRVVIDDSKIVPSSDDLVSYKFVTKEEFLQLAFQPGEGTITAYADQIWP